MLVLVTVDAVVTAMVWFRIRVSYGTGMREGGGGLGAGPGAAGPAPKRASARSLHLPPAPGAGLPSQPDSRISFASACGFSSQEPVTGGFVFSPTLRAGAVFYTCRSTGSNTRYRFV